jgi:predicted permease
MRVDLLHLARTLRRSPASAAAAVLTLSLTLGAGASIFAVVDAVLLTPPPFLNPDALVILGETALEQSGGSPRAVGYGTFEAWRERAAGLATIEALDGTNFTLTGLGAAERVSAGYVTPGYLPLLGVAPTIGRGFDNDDVGQPIALVSHQFWRGKLAGDRDVVGRKVTLGSRPHTIVGVLPERFVFALNTNELWLPFAMTPARAVSTGQRVSVVARLAASTTPTALASALDDVSRTSTPPARVVATPISAAIAGGAERTLSLLAGAAALAMIIAFTNLAGLLIVRAIDRRRELAVRSALGARGFDIIRLLLTEAQALVALGTIGGVLLAMWLTPVVGRLTLERFGGVANRDLAVSWRVIVVVAVLASACAWICGLVPAVMAARRSVSDALRREVGAPPRERMLRRVLVSGEVALAFVLLVSMTLVGRSLARVLAVNPGFEARGVLALSLSVPIASYPTERVVAFYSALQRGLEERLGPKALAVIDELPLTGDRGRSVVTVRPSDTGREAVVRAAGTAYFDVMRIPVVAGRGFDGRDDLSAPLRAVVSTSLADALFASGQAVGRQIRLTGMPNAAEVVGVVGDVKHRALDEAVAPTVYLPAWQAPGRSNHLVVRTPRPDADVIAAVREEVARLDRDVPVYGRVSMQEVVAASPGMAARRVLTATFLGFALLAVLLGAVGLFGIVAHDVASRRGELALRIALGADPARILGATFAQGAVVLGSGLAAGAVLSLWAARLLTGVLLAGDRLDAVSLSVPAAVILLAGIAAVYPAARRAMRTDPATALRRE